MRILEVIRIPLTKVNQFKYTCGRKLFWVSSYLFRNFGWIIHIKGLLFGYFGGKQQPNLHPSIHKSVKFFLTVMYFHDMSSCKVMILDSWCIEPPVCESTELLNDLINIWTLFVASHGGGVSLIRMGNVLMFDWY